MLNLPTSPEEQYLKWLAFVLKNGVQKSDPQKVGNLAYTGVHMRWNPSTHFPQLTTKKVPFKAIVYELLWFLRGDTNVKYLQDHSVTIWDEWATAEACAQYGHEPGELGPIYGEQWRRWPTRDGKTIDQIQRVLDELHSNPDSRRLLVSSWNPEDVDRVFIAPCHGIFKFFHANGVLSLNLWQRSGDMFLGIPFNMSSYSLLLIMVAQVVGMKVGEVVHTIADAHIYLNHIDQCKEQLTRTPGELPKVILDASVKNLFDFDYPHFKLEEYNPLPAIQAEVGI